MTENKYFRIEKKDFYTLITITSDKLDVNIAPNLKSELVLIAGNGEKNLIIDLENVKYCDSTGLTALLVAHRLTKNAKGVLVLANLQKPVERLIIISQLKNIFNIADSLAEAEEIMKVLLERNQQN